MTREGAWSEHPDQPAGRLIVLGDDPAVPEPDIKDWTWTITRPCPDCGFDAEQVTTDQIAPLTLAAGQRLLGALERPEARSRPHPTTWSALEYVAHVGDVCEIFAERVRLMQVEDDPQFANWDQDRTALERRYWELPTAQVAREARAALHTVSGVFGAMAADQWQRRGLRSNGSQFTIDTLGRYFLHDLAHHAWDIGA